MVADLNILLVEDDPALAASVEILLGVYNALVWVKSLAEAREILHNNNKLDLILLDKHLPDGNGLDLVGEIRRANVQTPIVVITGDADFRSVAQSLKAGADDYVLKGRQFGQDLIVRIPIALTAARARQAEKLVPASVRLPGAVNAVNPESYKHYLDAAEKEYLERTLALTNWDTQAASKTLGIARSTLFKKLQDLGVRRGEE